jgi:hypothetical protein
MSKLVCTCGHTLIDQSDFISYKAHVLADQDYEDFYDDIEKKIDEDLPARTIKYFMEIFQCINCSNLIIFKNMNRYDFVPADKDHSRNLLCSSMGAAWKGTMSANYKDGIGEIYWYTNYETGFRQNIELEELISLYQAKFTELSNLNILRTSFLRVNGVIQHQFEENEN